MTDLHWIALALAVICLFLAGVAHVRLHIADELRDEHAEWLGTGGTEFTHDGSVTK